MENKMNIADIMYPKRGYLYIKKKYRVKTVEYDDLNFNKLDANKLDISLDELLNILKENKFYLNTLSIYEDLRIEFTHDTIWDGPYSFFVYNVPSDAINKLIFFKPCNTEEIKKFYKALSKFSNISDEVKLYIENLK